MHVPTAPATGSLLTLSGLTKTFGSLTACDRIDLDIRPGEIHALLGENGAGKSTLVKMLYGVLAPDAGTIVWQGRPVAIHSPSEARSLGIGMVFQHFSLFEALTVAENVALSLDRSVSIAGIARQAQDMSHAYGLPLDPSAHVADLSVGERQRIEIVRTLLQNPQLIVLDEPTSVLTPQEADRLFITLEQLKGEGRSILYISHRLDEVRRICDRATILRHGKVVGACDPRQESVGSLAQMMVGTAVEGVTQTARGVPGTVLLEARSLSASARTPFSVALSDISFSVAAGEILAIAGVAGNGQSELFDALSGELPAGRGDALTLMGAQVGNMGISGRRLLGAAFVPEERHGHGAVSAMTLSENMVLARHRSDAATFLGRLGFIRRKAVHAAMTRVSKAMDVRKGSDDPPASALSGGNLQKYIVGRELDRKPSVLVVNQPTWGVDAGAATRIRQALVDLAAAGAAVIVISQDLDEIFEVAHRIAVIADGRLSTPEAAGTMTRERIGILMGGAGKAAHSHGASAKSLAHAH